MRNKFVFSAAPNRLRELGYQSSKPKKSRKKKIVTAYGTPTSEQLATIRNTAKGLDPQLLLQVRGLLENMTLYDIQTFFQGIRQNIRHFYYGRYSIFVTSIEGGKQLELWDEDQLLVDGDSFVVAAFALRYCRRAFKAICDFSRFCFIKPVEVAADIEDFLEECRAYRDCRPILNNISKFCQLDCIDDGNPVAVIKSAAPCFVISNRPLLDPLHLSLDVQQFVSNPSHLPSHEEPVYYLRTNSTSAGLLQTCREASDIKQLFVRCDDVTALTYLPTCPLKVVHSVWKGKPHNLACVCFGGKASERSFDKKNMLERVKEANLSRNELILLEQTLKRVRDNPYVQEIQDRLAIPWRPPCQRKKNRHYGRQSRLGIKLQQSSGHRYRGGRKEFVKLCRKRILPSDLQGPWARIPDTALPVGPLSCNDNRLGSSRYAFRSIVNSVQNSKNFALRWTLGGWLVEKL